MPSWILWDESIAARKATTWSNLPTAPSGSPKKKSSKTFTSQWVPRKQTGNRSLMTNLCPRSPGDALRPAGPFSFKRRAHLVRALHHDPCTGSSRLNFRLHADWLELRSRSIELLLEPSSPQNLNRLPFLSQPCGKDLAKNESIPLLE